MLTLLACTDKAEPLPQDTAEPPASGNIYVNPTMLSFSAALGDAPAVETVTVTNFGLGDLNIRGLGLDGDEAYTVGSIGAVLVPTGGSTSFDVAFSPLTTSPVEAFVTIRSDDPDAPEQIVELAGQGEAPILTLSPSDHDFGAIWVGCEETAAIQLTNSGSVDLVVTDVEYVSSSADLSFDADEATNGPLPWTIPRLESREVVVRYSPADSGDDEGSLLVTSSDPLQPEAQATQAGSGALYAVNIDEFSYSPGDAVDLLLVVDNSSGMEVWVAQIVGSVAPLLTALAGHDYQIGVISTDSPVFRGEVISPTTIDAIAELESQLQVGSGGSGMPMPSEMAYQSTHQGDGEEFRRTDADFALVVIGHQPDSSPSTWNDYLTHFQGLVREPQHFVTHAISGDWPTGCGPAAATTTVYELTVETGGLYLSICEPDWAESIQQIVAATVEPLTFSLSDWPVVDTLEVWLDGGLLTSGWTYDEVANNVAFDEGALPDAAAELEVHYVVTGECSE